MYPIRARRRIHTPYYNPYSIYFGSTEAAPSATNMAVDVYDRLILLINAAMGEYKTSVQNAEQQSSMDEYGIQRQAAMIGVLESQSTDVEKIMSLIEKSGRFFESPAIKSGAPKATEAYIAYLNDLEKIIKGSEQDPQDRRQLIDSIRGSMYGAKKWYQKPWPYITLGAVVLIGGGVSAWRSQ